LGILATISWFCREYQKIYAGIEIEPRIEIEEREVPADLKTVLFRILQEAMNNVAKHSGAGRVRLSLRKQEGALRLVVEDDGIGFDPSRVQCADPDLRGFGLTSMKERAELTGGSLQIESKPGEGTRLQGVWPIRKEK
jgi:signal transduction histidine kinase